MALRRRRKVQRRQRVMMRGRARQEHLNGLGAWSIRMLVVVALIASIPWILQGEQGIGVYWRSRHTPRVSFQISSPIPEDRLRALLKVDSVWIWLPWRTRRFADHLRQTYPSLATVQIDKNFYSNRVNVKLVARKPLAWVGDQVMDASGTIFTPLTPPTESLPRLKVKPDLLAPSTGPWLSALTKHSSLWNDIMVIDSDLRGNAIFQTHSGARVTWGVPDPAAVDAQAQALLAALQDADSQWGGAASVDLTLFEEGRIVVRPKKLGTQSVRLKTPNLMISNPSSVRPQERATQR